MKKNLIYLIVLFVLSVIALTLSYAHYGNILIDCGREVYYPVQILQGKILYKDIFNIYGPFSYQFNAVLFKLFGINLNVLYLFGCLCAIAIVNLVYLIAKRFLPQYLSFTIAVFTISVGVLSTHLFNFVFPYSYAMLYGLVSILFSIFLFLKYQENPDKKLYLYLSCFFAGLSVTSKYEFLLYLPVLLFFIFKTKKISLKELYYVIFSLLFVPVFCFGILFLQGMNLADLSLTVSTLNKLAHSKMLKFFYTTEGIFFDIHLIPFAISGFCLVAFSLAIFYFGFTMKSKILSILIILSASTFAISFIKTDSFTFLPYLILILFVFNFKRIINNLPLLFLIIANFAISMKVFWGMVVSSYGLFFVSLNLITLLSIIFYLFKDKNINQKTIGAYILVIAIIFGYSNYRIINTKKYELKTDKGNIYLNKYFYKSSQQLLNYINNNTKQTDKIVIFPEGTFINFLTDRTSDNYYNSLIPLYFEILEEDKLIEHFKNTKPEYIIFNNLDMSKDYYFKNICNDYAFRLCKYVSENYTQDALIDNGLRFLIFKIN